jgi:hypothetical protein
MGNEPTGPLNYIQVLAWPIVALLAMFLYRKLINSLIPRSKFTLKISGLSIEVSPPVIEQSVAESLGGRNLTSEELRLLSTLRNDGRKKFDRTEASLRIARQLRNAGLIRSYPTGEYLQNAAQIEVTTLGKLIADAADRA